MKSPLDNITLKFKIGENMAKAKNEKKTNPILLFLFAIVIPVIIVLVIAVFGLSLAGIDVVGWAKDKGSNVPVVSHFIKTDEEKSLEQKLTRANETIEVQKEEIDDLKKEIESLESIVDDLELDVTRLENRHTNEGSLTTDESPKADEIKQAASSFRKMDEEKAANIVQNLERNTAVAILSSLSGDVRGGILAEMEPQAAAEIMEAMTVQ